MSSASLMDTPAKPSSSRSVPVITVRDSVAGRVGSPFSAGTATWADIASLAPAAIAARNGHELAGIERRARSLRTTASSWWVSWSTAPRPGKCFIVAATPAAWSPRTIAAPSRPTAAGSSPNERIPSAGVAGFGREVEDRARRRR